ncbi:MAG: DUF475 domain-containing protein [Blastocatellales bacterium]
MKHFRFSILVTVICLAAAFLWGGWMGMAIATILGVMEVSLSFDNAVVNAAKLKTMSAFWQKLFLTVGILIAVFGMRLFFPVEIVSVATGMGFMEVANLALRNPAEYSRHLLDSHVQIAMFGGIFLLLVFLSFILDEEKELHWLGKFEERLAKFGKLDMITVIIALLVVVITQRFLPQEERLDAILAGVAGIILFIAVDSLGRLFESEEGAAVAANAKRAGLMGLLYLEVLDASFSFDGVIGAFAITKDVVIIMLGLAIGAMFVRSMTVFLVQKGTLDEYVFLEHGAHYAIGALALIMLASTSYHIPEIVTGLIGVGFIVLSLWSSVLYKRREQAEEEVEA